MGSFQQVVMGGICLVAVFWFGSFINQQPAALQQPLEHLSNATVGSVTSHSQVPSQLAAKPRGGLFSSSFFDAPAKPRSVTLSDLKSRSTSNTSNVVAQNPKTPLAAAQKLRLPERVTDSATEVVSDFVKPPSPDFDGEPSFIANNGNDQQRLEIVPDFSTLARDFRREQAQYQRNDRVSESQAVSKQHGAMLPVPKLDDFSRASFGESIEQPNRDWNVVRQGVLSVEEKLKQFHKAHPAAEEFEPLRSGPLRSAESRFPVVSTTTSGRFIPESQSRQQEIDRKEVERLELALREYERQELARQELQRQEFVKRRSQAFSPSSSWNSSNRQTTHPIPSNQLRSESQLADRWQARENRFEPSHPPAPPESLAQRQERWKVFGDRTREVEHVMDRRDNDNDRYAQSRSVGEARPRETSSIPEKSRVRSLYNMQFEDGAGLSDRTARQQDTFGNQKTAQSPTQRQRPSSASLANDVGPEVIRYGDFKTYVTKGGDTLQTISESFFGTPEFYFDLYLANRNVLVNPATVPTGVELRIPHMGE